MISLKKHTSEYEKNYFEKIWNNIENKVNAEIYNLANIFSEALLGSTINKTFFEDIICLSANDARDKYDSVELYYNLTYICCYDLQKNIKGTCPTSDYKYIRASWYQKINVSSEVRTSSLIYMNANSLNENVICNSDTEWKKYVANIRPVYERLYECVGRIFNYEDDLDSEIKAELVKDLDLSVCPYCNRQFINSFIEGKKSRTTADMDHFLPKEKYILWSDSLYNLVPSCKVCNMLFKWKRNVNMYDPYQRGYDDDAYFTIGDKKPLTLSELMGWGNNDIKIELKISDNEDVHKKIEAESKLFRIEEVYDIHSKYVKDLLYKQAMIEKSITDEMIDKINEKLGKDAITLDEVREVLYGINLNNIDYRNVPLSKLTYDILKRRTI